MGAREVLASLELQSCHDALARRLCASPQFLCQVHRQRPGTGQEHRIPAGEAGTPEYGRTESSTKMSEQVRPATEEQEFKIRSPEPTKPGEDSFLESQHREAETGESLKITGQQALPINEPQAQTLSQKKIKPEKQLKETPDTDLDP